MKLAELIELPKEQCNDKKCPHHGHLKVRGFFFKGKVIKKSDNKTVKIEIIRYYWLPKYERYELRRTRITAYLPECLKDIKEGDYVLIGETRPLSKTKHFVVLGKLKKGIALTQ
ncbi:NEQ326 [Nanoarchaeum equitans Kin4-M]|uniref:Small ribosomal subunit protein uS17 n=1 Tax=Nanoarchaeum equitans (strain Kin4-M) TaxID=228908 RepID=RS17_NANEQ|nr:RecName: Full=Small ribosomal subunit protein uS17; AltName: Full=30S ribosomal protein S17 [Nanoarchaeum equitans Kin4-M]AAR39174.1 NEQ326 [Nanoarchaeum equitans Kin4-M]